MMARFCVYDGGCFVICDLVIWWLGFCFVIGDLVICDRWALVVVL